MSANMDDAEFLAAVEKADLPGASAVLVNREGELYSHGSGLADVSVELPMTPDTPCPIASCSKAITSLAAMQLVEQGKLELDAPIGSVVPQLANPHVITGWSKEGQAETRPAKRPITLRHLLTHTAGFGYAFMHQPVLQFLSSVGMPAQGTFASINTPLMFDPGEDWDYSVATDWAGIVVQEASGQTLGDYLREAVLEPLGMHATEFRVEIAEGDGVAHRRLAEGGFEATPFSMAGAEFEMGGAGLTSTTRDYSRFLQAMLRGGELDGNRVIGEHTFAELTKLQTGTLRAGQMGTIMPELSGAMDLMPDQHCGWSLGFLVNPETGPNGRSPGSQGWAGIFNLYYWFDVQKDRAGIFTTQLLPFADQGAVEAFGALERLAYR